MTAIKATKEQVFNACNLLVSQNKKVTVDAVLELTKGSKSTVAPHVKKWREENPDAGYNPNNFASMPNEVVEGFKKIWTQAVMQAEQMTDNDIIAVQEERINQLEIQLQDKEKKLVDYDEMKGELKAFNKMRTELIAIIDKQSRENVELKKEMEKENAELKDKVKKLEKILRELPQAKVNSK